MQYEYRIAKESLQDKSVVVCNCGTVIVYPATCTDHPKYCYECQRIQNRKLNTRHKKLDSFGGADVR
jgi:hypothetical protein